MVVYNPLPWKRSGVVAFDAPGFSAHDLKPADGGAAVRVDVTDSHVCFFAHDIPPMGYRTYVAAKVPAIRHAAGLVSPDTIQSPFFTARLDPSRGIVASLVDKRSGRELAGTTDGLGLGQYLYERFDKDRVMQWCSNYVKGPQLWPDFYKPGQPPSDQFPYQAASPQDFNLRFEETAVSVDAVMDCAATADPARGDHAPDPLP